MGKDITVPSFFRCPSRSYSALCYIREGRGRLLLLQALLWKPLSCLRSLWVFSLSKWLLLNSWECRGMFDLSHGPGLNLLTKGGHCVTCAQEHLFYWQWLPRKLHRFLFDLKCWLHIWCTLAKQTASARNQEHLQGSDMRRLMGLQAAGWRVAEFKCSHNQNELLEYLQKLLVLVNLEESLWKNNGIDFTRSLMKMKTCVWPHLTSSSGSKLSSIDDIRYAVLKSELPSIHCLPMITEQTAQLAQ